MKSRVLGLAAVGLVAGAAVAGYRRLMASPTPDEIDEPRVVRASVAVEGDPLKLYRFWRDLANLPQLTDHLDSVEILDERRSRWRARGPLGATVEWEAEIVEEHPGQLLSWRSIPGTGVTNAGEVTFGPATGGRGVVIEVTLSYEPPAGALGPPIARLLGGEPEQQLKDALRRFKQLAETGELARVEGQPSGRSAQSGE